MAHWESIAGWFDFREVYQMLVERGQDGDTFVEVGSYLGRSGCCFGELIKTSGKKITLLCVDQWPAQFDFGKDGIIEAPFETFYSNVRQSGLTKIIVPIRAESTWAAQFVANDLAAVFIDGDHEYAGCSADIKAWLPKVRVSGILAGHDFSNGFPGVVKAARQAFGTKFRTMGQCWIYDKPA